MAFAVVDLTDNILLSLIRKRDTVGEINLFLPFFKENKSKICKKNYKNFK